MRQPLHNQPLAKLPSQEHNLQNMQQTRALLIHVQDTHARTHNAATAKFNQHTKQIFKQLRAKINQQPNNQTRRVHHIKDGMDQDVTKNSEGDSYQAEEVTQKRPFTQRNSQKIAPMRISYVQEHSIRRKTP